MMVIMNVFFVYLSFEFTGECHWALLNPHPSNKMNAYAITADIKNPHAEGLELMMPIEKRVTRELDYKIYEEMKLIGIKYSGEKRK